MKEWTASEMARKSNKNLTDRQRQARRENARKATASRLARKTFNQAIENKPNIVAK